MAYALTLPGLDVGRWQRRDHYDAAAVALADEHYSRRTPGSACIGPPGRKLVLVSPCERAVWLSSYTVKPDDGLDAFRCSIFRNTGAGLSSELIRDAMLRTELAWADVVPLDGWVTWVDTAAVESPNPGYCFKRAGWWLDREWNPARGRRGKVRLRATPILLVGPERSEGPPIAPRRHPLDALREGAKPTQGETTPANRRFLGPESRAVGQLDGTAGL